MSRRNDLKNRTALLTRYLHRNLKVLEDLAAVCEENGELKHSDAAKVNRMFWEMHDAAYRIMYFLEKVTNE